MLALWVNDKVKYRCPSKVQMETIILAAIWLSDPEDLVLFVEDIFPDSM